MSLHNIIKRKSKLLLPFSWLYGAGAAIHNKIYDWGLKTSFQPGLPVICVGNLAVGGTGKTPMVEYLLRFLSVDFKVATISRGYKRQSSGVIIANENITAREIGDEPMQFHTKFPDVKVVVGEKRVEALHILLNSFPQTQVVILDDAFQHRAIKAGFNILLTDHQNLFTDDYLLPAGQLRDLKSSHKRADIIVVTKCPADLSEQQRKKIIEKIKPLFNQSVLFTATAYGTPYHIFRKTERNLESVKFATLVTGIANPEPMENHLKRHDISLDLISFPDHHHFNQNDISQIKQSFQKIKNTEKIIITTEKDAMRLREFEDSLKDLPVFALPVQHQFLFDEGGKFEDRIRQYILKK